jgi:hypothetical protein
MLTSGVLQYPVPTCVMEQLVRDCNPNEFELTYNQNISIFPRITDFKNICEPSRAPRPSKPWKKAPLNLLSPAAAHIQDIISNQEAEKLQ